MYAVVASMFTCILIGYIYEWFGRKYPLTIFSLTLGGLLCSLPHLDGDTVWITIVRVLVSITCKATLQNPLMVDMVKPASRGGAEGWQAGGGQMGELTAFVMLMEIQQAGTENKWTWYVLGGFCVFIGILVVFFIDNYRPEYVYTKKKSGGTTAKKADLLDVDFTKHQKIKGARAQKLTQQVGAMTNSMYAVARGKDPIYLLCFYGCLVARLLTDQFTTFYLLWILTFCVDDSIDPVPEGFLTRTEGLDLYQNITITGMVLSLFLMPGAGVLGDIVPYEVQIVFSFGLRMVAVAGFFLLETPFGLTSYLTVMAILIGTNIELVTINSLYAKKLPKDVRGAMNGMISSVASMGNLAFSQLAIVLMKE